MKGEPSTASGLLLAGGDKPTWSLTGEWITFARENRRDHDAWQVAIVRPDASGLRAVSDAIPDERPRWRRDGRTLVYARLDGQGIALYGASVADGAMRRIASADD